MKTLCVYNYYEKNSLYKNNCLFFLNNGINNYSDFIFVVNGKSTIKFPEKDNILVIYRENIGYDFMAYSHVLNNINIDYYDYFIFINTSVKGPFIKNNHDWQSIFINLIKNDVKLVGTTINIFSANPICIPPFQDKLDDLELSRPYTHIQSMMFAMDKECLRFLKDLIFIENALDNFDDTIIFKEIMMTQYVLKNNWNINVTAPLYQGYDYRTLKTDPNYTSNCGDPSYNGGYFGGNLDPYEVIFIKTNRNINYRKIEINIILLIILLILLILLIYMSFIIVSRQFIFSSKN
jgi:hypothetical protein